MQTLTIAPPDRQQDLIYLAPIFNCKNNASARNAYGMAAQEIVWNTLNLNPIRINGNFDCCFDAEKDGVYYEIKSVKTTGKIVIYDWRMLKEARSGVKLKYAILIHTIKGCRDNILFHMQECRPRIVLLDYKVMHKIALAFPLKVYKKTAKINGYNRKGYVDGYRNVPVAELFKHPHQIVYT